MSKPKEYHSAYDGVHVDGDGDMLCAKFDDFVNLQESDCGFGRTDAEAIVELAKETRKRLEARVAELEAALNDIKQMTSKAASLTRYADAVHEFDGVNHWQDLSEINALCGPKEAKP
jgi:endonuclease III